VIVDDGKGGKTTTTVTVNVGAEQDAYDDIEGTGFGKSVTIDVLGNDEFEGATSRSRRSMARPSPKAVLRWPDRRQRQRQAGGRPTGVHAQGGLCG
jgi:hypothetical protein